MKETFEVLVNNVCRAVPSGRRELTRTALAERCGVSRQELYDLMRGNRGGTDATRRKLAAGLRVSRARIDAALARTQAEAWLTT